MSDIPAIDTKCATVPQPWSSQPIRPGNQDVMQLPTQPASVRLTPVVSHGKYDAGTVAPRGPRRPSSQMNYKLPNPNEESAKHTPQSSETTQTPKPNAKRKRPRRAHANTKDSTPNTSLCFLCFEKGPLQYAVVVELQGPIIDQKSKKRAINAEPSSRNQKSIDPGAFEIQAMQAIKDAVYQHHGKWKRLLWGFEIRTAEETNVRACNRSIA